MDPHTGLPMKSSQYIIEFFFMYTLLCLPPVSNPFTSKVPNMYVYMGKHVGNGEPS